MPDLALLPGISGKLTFSAVNDAADRVTWLEPPPATLPASAVVYGILLRFGAADPAAPFLYTVEQDAEAADEAELNAWYAQEHMPRLAAVPGVIAARRYAAIDATTSPRYLAAYWLERHEVFECPAWIVARETPWTERARTFFRNTRRTIRRLEALP